MYLSPRTREEDEKEEDEVGGCGGGRHSVNSTHMHAHPFPFSDTPFPVLVFVLFSSKFRFSSCFGPKETTFLTVKLGDEVDGVLDGSDRCGFLLGDFRVELFLDGHDELNSVQRVGTQVIDEGCGRDDLVGLDAELFDDDALDLLLELCAHEECRVGTDGGRPGDEGRGGGGECGGRRDEG
eukprot:CAMPEP_0113453538 /NCGR_PEP_ID=MMETSP0014_2-20120614/7406_1 /TAXON_ID=2857 /ORGANISM="Nitzschia sp." /LENGTH=180 /DNA_ID=CAMNT_0000344929 /DNA_START=100 /DNA_END=638 /DNA_ORIENTATION=+ /assembly_acc=CAM_ASM_000159